MDVWSFFCLFDFLSPSDILCFSLTNHENLCYGISYLKTKNQPSSLKDILQKAKKNQLEWFSKAGWIDSSKFTHRWMDTAISSDNIPFIQWNQCNVFKRFRVNWRYQLLLSFNLSIIAVGEEGDLFVWFEEEEVRHHEDFEDVINQLFSVYPITFDIQNETLEETLIRYGKSLEKFDEKYYKNIGDKHMFFFEKKHYDQTMYHAVCVCSMPTLDFLFQSGCEVDMATIEHTIHSGDLWRVDWAFQHLQNDISWFWQNNFLNAACACGNINVVDYLMMQDFQISEENVKKLLDWCLLTEKSFRENCLRWLDENEILNDYTEFFQFYLSSIIMRDKEMMEYLFNKGIVFNESLLTMAFQLMEEWIVEWLLSHSCPQNSSDIFAFTSLTNKPIKYAEFLIQMGMNISDCVPFRLYNKDISFIEWVLDKVSPISEWYSFALLPWEQWENDEDVPEEEENREKELLKLLKKWVPWDDSCWNIVLLWRSPKMMKYITDELNIPYSYNEIHLNLILENVHEEQWSQMLMGNHSEESMEE